MRLYKVVGTVISQEKEACLTGKKLLLCEAADGRRIVAVDMVGAGVGSDVLVSRSSPASPKGELIDEWIVGIVDSVAES